MLNSQWKKPCILIFPDILREKNIFSLANSTLSWLEIIFDISYENWSQSLLIGFSQRKSIIEDIEWNLSISLRKKGCNKVSYMDFLSYLQNCLFLWTIMSGRQSY